ncbi:phage tail protein [Methylocapsa acidiphila]|uniref:phage tail protein n=1 Tax=Methylocapsa acidiphila TaxID=133552 RepID=UPI0004236CB9|nr:phage tail protein [Methylocapsa acidiphila]
MRAAEIARLLPEIYQDALDASPALCTILDIMERLHAPDERVVANIDAYFDPRRAPDAFVEMMARWLALGPYLERDPLGQRRAAVGPAALRDLVAVAAELARYRGTADAMIAFLERATGVTGFTIEENPPDSAGRPQPFHIRVGVPPAAAAKRDLVSRIVAGERPAWVTFELCP